MTSVLTWLGAFSNQHLGLASPLSSVLGVAIAGHRRHKLARRGRRCPVPGPEDTELKEDG